jgi:hypothetical protein
VFRLSVAEGVVYEPLPQAVLTGYDLGIDLQEHLDTVSGPLGDLRRRNAGVEPRGDTGVA